MFSYLIFQKKLRTMVTKITSLICLRIVVMNPKSHFDNDWGLNLNYFQRIHFLVSVSGGRELWKKKISLLVNSIKLLVKYPRQKMELFIKGSK